jgi:hypothetical protein
MAIGHRIKATGINCPSHLRKFAEESGNEKANAECLVQVGKAILILPRLLKADETSNCD